MSIDSGLRRVTDAVRERIPELFDVIRNRLQQETPDYSSAGNARISAAESDTIAASLRDVLDYIADPSGNPVRASNEALREVRLAAHAGVSLQILMAGSRIAQDATSAFILEEAHRLIADDAVRIAVLRRASAHQFAWNRVVAEVIIDAFASESTVYALQSRERRKVSTVNALLAGLPVDTGDLEYTFDGGHVAARVWHGAPDAVTAALRSHLNVRPLMVTHPNGEGDIWMPWPARLGAPAGRLAAVILPAGARVAFGGLGEGIDGFRSSYRQAGEARRVAEALDLERVCYDEVMLEAVAMHDMAATRAFVLDELGPLGDAFDPGNALVETLRVYYAVGENAVTTGQRLGVHNRTVAYRLRAVESKIGADAMHREELVIALRLVALVAAVGPRAQDTAASGLSAPAR